MKASAPPDTPVQPVVMPSEGSAWLAALDPLRPFDTLRVDGERCRIVERDGQKDVIVDLPGFSHVLVRAERRRAAVYSTSAVMPVYSRVDGDRVTLSNIAFELVKPGEEVALNTFVLMQQILGANYPRHNIFRDLDLLEYNGAFDVTTGGLRYRGTTLERVDGATVDSTMEIAYGELDRLLSTGRPVCVLISGGYDSRLNLAVALQCARRYGNRVFTFHEYKGEDELEIAHAVTSAAGVPMQLGARQLADHNVEGLVFDPAFIRMHSGTYRDNIPRWHRHIERIRSDAGDAVILGLGAEAHKGKHYAQIEDLRRDGERVLGADTARVLAAARALAIREFDTNSQADFFDRLCARAKSFSAAATRIDFIHYQTYVANGYGHRCSYFNELFGIPFPFLHPGFLSHVFSLPGDDKKDYKMVRDGIAAIAPDLFAIPYMSGNAKTLKDRPSRYRFLRQWAAPIRRRIAPARRGRKGRTTLTAAERTYLLESTPISPVSKQIHASLLGDSTRAPGRLEYLMSAYLYLKLLEDERGASLACT